MPSWPIGTRAEVEELGLDVNETRSCSPAGEKWFDDGRMMKQAGCEFYDRDIAGIGHVQCMFASSCPAVGATGQAVKPFRDHGPKNVGVFIKLDKSETLPGQSVSPSTILFMPCFNFESSLRARYETQRETGEIIAIAGVEGDGREYPQNTVEEIENTQDPRGPKRKVIVRKNLPIPSFPRPSEAMGDIQYGRAAAVALQGERDQEVADAMAAHIGDIVGTAKVPVYEGVKEKKAGKA